MERLVAHPRHRVVSDQARVEAVAKRFGWKFSWIDEASWEMGGGGCFIGGFIEWVPWAVWIGLEKTLSFFVGGCAGVGKDEAKVIFLQEETEESYENMREILKR